MKQDMIQKHACGYADAINDIYLDKNHPKCKRVKDITAYLKKKDLKMPIYSTIDVGSGPGYIALQIAKILDCNVDAVDFSLNECVNAIHRIDGAIERSEVRPEQVEVYFDDIFDPKTKIMDKKYDLVFCADIMGSYDNIDDKVKLAHKLFDYKNEDGSLLVTALCCEDDKLADKYLRGDIIQYESEGEIVKVPLFSETPEFYASLFGTLHGYKVEHKRLDKECVLFYM